MKPAGERWFLLVLIAMAAFAGACTRAAETPAAPGALQTQVAATLTAAPTQPPSETSPPSATPAPSQTASAVPSTTPSQTGTPGPSPTPTGPVLDADDPRQGINLNAPDHRDDFSAAGGWFANYEDNTVALMLEDQRLRTTDKLADTLITWSTSGQTGGDFYLEITAEIGNCTGADAAGLATRVGNADYSRGYAFEVSCDGRFRLRKFISFNSIPAVLVDWTASDVIHKGPNTSNRLGFLARGGTLTVFANGESLATFNDPDYVWGNFAVFASAAQGETTVRWDDFALWRLE